jgi:hypothetical protein
MRVEYDAHLDRIIYAWKDYRDRRGRLLRREHRKHAPCQYGLGIDLAPQANQFPQIRLCDSGWESLRFTSWN